MATNPDILMREINTAIGLNGKTGLPLKIGAGLKCNTDTDLKIKLREQDKAINSNMWDWCNTFLRVNGQWINRMLYYRGQLAYAYMSEIEEFVLLPFVVDGNLDMYGRPKYIRLIPFTGAKKDPKMKPIEDYLATKKFRVIWSINDPIEADDLDKVAVILYDRTPDLGNFVLAQNLLNEVLINYEAEIYTYMRTNLINATGVSGLKVGGKDEIESVMNANANLQIAAKTAQKWVPIVGNAVDFQELVSSNGNTQEFLQAAQAIRNLRLNLNGLPSGGIYDKSQYVNKSQTSMNQGEVDSALVLQDKYSCRDNFCTLVDYIWRTGIDCLPSENIVMTDLDANGVMFDDETDNHNMEVMNNDMSNDTL